jgi:EmrB/QacA subfamily drug resistance transporter
MEGQGEGRDMTTRARKAANVHPALWSFLRIWYTWNMGDAQEKAEKQIVQQAGGADKWMVFALVASGVFMSTLDSSIVNIALPVIMSDFAVPLTVIEWVPMIYLLTVSSLLLTCGRLSDIRGRRAVYCGGFMVFTVGSLLCGMAASPAWLIASRVLQGVGAAMLMACSPALVVDAFPLAERGRAMGMVGMVVAAGLTTGPALGGLILELFTWRAIFYINVPIGVVVTVAALRILRTMGKRGSGGRMDWTGALLLLVCFSALIAGLSHIHLWGLVSLRTGLAAMLFLASAAGLVWVETRCDQPVFDPSLLRIRLFVYPVAAATIVFVGLFFITLLMPFFMVHPLGFGMNKVGSTMIIPFLFLFVVAPLSGILSDRMGSRGLCTVGMTLLTASLALLSRLSAEATIVDMAWPLALAGIGIAVFVSPNSAAAMSAVPPRHRGIASGSVATARNLGMVLGVALAGMIFNDTFRNLNGGEDLTHYRPVLESAFMAAFGKAMLSGAAVTAVGILVAWMRGSDHGRKV